MKKRVLIFLALFTLAGLFAAQANAVTVNTEHGLVYYLWDSEANEGENRSNNTPTNQMGIGFAEVDGTSAMKLTYAPNGAGKDPYYSLRAVALDDCKYCVINYYYETPDPSKTAGGRFWYLDGASGKWAYLNFDYKPNEWVKQVISFTPEDAGFSGDEWQASGKTCGWFRLNVNLTENYDALYIRSIAFFKTREEAEKFDGLADTKAYTDLRLQALSLKPERYSNFDAVTAALANDASDVFYSYEQPRLDEAYNQLKTALDALSIKSEHGEAQLPAVDKIPVLGAYPAGQTEPSTAPTATEPVTTPANVKPGDSSGCNALIGSATAGLSIGGVALFALLCAKKEKKERE